MGVIILMHILHSNGFNVPLPCFLVMYAALFAKIAMAIKANS